MYQYRDGRLYANVEQQKVSLALPANWWIETDPFSVCDGGITLRTPDGMTLVDFRVWPSIYPDAREELERSLDESGCMFWEGPLAVEVGELLGWCLFTGRDGVLDACEVCVDVGKFNVRSAEGELYDRIDLEFYSQGVDIRGCRDMWDFLRCISVIDV